MEREPKAERKGRSVAEVCTSEARKIGETLAPREGSALRKAWFPYSRSSERMNYRVGVAGRNRPAWEGDGGRKAAAVREGLSSLKKRLAAVVEVVISFCEGYLLGCAEESRARKAS